MTLLRMSMRSSVWVPGRGPSRGVRLSLWATRLWWYDAPQQQAERIHLHIRPVQLYGQTVLGDENLLHYLFEMLEGKTSPSSSQGGEIASEVKDDNYVVFHIPLTSHLSPFTSYLCRQIVRDHGEATNLRGCGITTDNNQVTITLPRYHGQV